MPREDRKQLILMAEKHNFLIVEDNPYSYFRYDTEKIPTLKALDTYQRVLHIGSFAKTIFPSLRLGYLVADQTVSHNGRRTRLVEEFKKTKSFITVNTSTLLQAMVGGFLHRENYSLVKSCLKKVDACRKKRDTMIEALERQFTSPGSWTENIKWSKPKGGFFLVLNVPFKVTDELLKECVQDYSVIFCPMSFFCLKQTEQNQHQIRLAFSNLSEEKIQQGIQRLADFIKAKM
jgi:(S)-3,5-dihydroxyphenylglycine transaminase